QGWEPVGPSSHCGRGSWAQASADFRRTVGIPYVVLDISTTASPKAAGKFDLDVQLKIQKLSGFDKDGKTVYARSLQKRTLSVTGEGDLVLPLLIPDQREAEAFGIHEVLLSLRAQLAGGESASYGRLAVSADEPGAEVLLDGGFAGRIVEGKPTLLENVL